MSDEKKLDLNDLDLSGLGETIPVEEEVDSCIEEEVSSEEEDPIQKEGYWVNGKPVSTVSHMETAHWIAGKLPGTKAEGFKESQFDNTSKRQTAVDKVIAIYLSVSLIFPVKERPKEYLN